MNAPITPEDPEKMALLQEEELKYQYDMAYARTVFCRDSEYEEAARSLNLWRRRYLDFKSSLTNTQRPV